MKKSTRVIFMSFKKKKFKISRQSRFRLSVLFKNSFQCKGQVFFKKLTKEINFNLTSKIFFLKKLNYVKY